MILKICVYGRHVASLNQLVRDAKDLGLDAIDSCRHARLYFLSPSSQDKISETQIRRLCAALLADEVVEYAEWKWLDHDDPAETVSTRSEKREQQIEVAFRPGVTDVPARELRRAMSDSGMPACEVATGYRYEINGELSSLQLERLARQLLCNDTIQRYAIGTIKPQFGLGTPSLQQRSPVVEQIPLLDLDDESLLILSRERLLSLDLAEMRVVQNFFRNIEREPSDVELETLAQTWSEHCVHKTFKAQIDFRLTDSRGRVHAEEIDGLFSQYIQAATERVLSNPSKADWVKSVFVDDAGVIAFDEYYNLAFKVETHNHPSALEPFGGANTGIGGVVRDIIGVSARPIATTNVLCFGPQHVSYASLPKGVLHPKRVAKGVVAGIGDYGNKLGLPTVNGSVIYDEGYLGNPLVFCGCVGLVPKGSHPTEAQPGDLVVVIGGRTGRDGIHGATFSSAELHQESVDSTGSAVQIGDPITEKGIIELVETFRDNGLYHAITDCGAGGFSSAVGEMGSELGVEIELANAPLKYAGLSAWEIWLSEAQERMVLAIPEVNLPRCQELADLWAVELFVLGRFTGGGELLVRYKDQVVAQLPMEFLHNGLPRRKMHAIWQEAAPEEPTSPAVSDWGQMLLTMLAHPTVASKEAIIRQYDHEVGGGTLVRPLVGPAMDGPADAALLKPLGTWEHRGAFTLSVGINPLLGKVDPYAMAVSAIDEAVRNAVAVGADPDRIALLDNFCWGNPTYPDRLGSLVRACQGCYDGAVAYGAPFISGKDSLYNEFEGQAIPGTLLISALGLVPDYQHRVTSALQEADNLLFLVGETRAEFGGSLLYALLECSGGNSPTIPQEPLERYRCLHLAIGRNLIQSCHDLSEGGLAVALAEMAIAGRLGVFVTLSTDAFSPLGAAELLFSESNGRLLLEVKPEDAESVRQLFQSVALLEIGRVSSDHAFTVTIDNQRHVQLPLHQLVTAWKGSAAVTTADADNEHRHESK